MYKFLLAKLCCKDKVTRATKFIEIYVTKYRIKENEHSDLC